MIRRTLDRTALVALVAAVLVVLLAIVAGPEATP